MSPSTDERHQGGLPPLEAHALRKSFRSDGGEVVAVRGVSLRLESGEILAFLGPNGAGKTTCIRMVAGLVLPDAGTVRVFGGDPYRKPQVLGRLGALLEGSRNLYWRLTPAENLEYFAMVRGMPSRAARQRAGELLERFGLADRVGTPVGKLSRGLQQRVSLAVAVAHRPGLLLLDEPTLGLDVASGTEVEELVRELAAEGCAVLLTTHQLDVAERLSHRVAILRRGEVIAEERTSALLERFAGDTWVVELAEEPPAPYRPALDRLGAARNGRRVVMVGDLDALWNLLEALRPLPLVRVERDAADLTAVFLALTTEEADGNPVARRAQA